MDPNETPDAPAFDLAAWVRDDMPALLDAEASADWREDHRTPVTDLMAEDSPLQSFLRSPGTPPEGLSRVERAEFYEAQRVAGQAAADAAQDAAQDHRGLVDMRARQASYDLVQSLLSRAVPHEDEGSRVPVKGPNQPTDVGRW